MIREPILFRPFFSLLLLLLFSPFCTYEPTSQIHPRPADYDALLEQIKNPQSRAKPVTRQKLFQAEKSASSEPMLAPHQGESKLVPEEASTLYSQLSDASTAMQERWSTIFKQMPTLLTDSEQRKAVQVILEKHLAYLASLGFDLSGMTESKGEQSA